MQTDFPKITIVTPSFNQEKYLEQTILSVIEQNYPNLEYIIIDGGSTDNSVEIIRKYESKLAYWVSEKDKGLYDGIQKGFERSTGEIMAWINSDDVYHRKSLFAVAGIFKEYPSVDWIMGKNSWYDEEGCTLSLKYNPMHESWSKWRLFNDKDNHIQQESVFWRRSLWQKAGSFISTKYQLAGDFDLWARFYEHTNLISCNFFLGGFRVRNQQQKSLDQISVYQKEQAQILHRYILLPQIKKQLAKIKTRIFLAKLIPFNTLRQKMTIKAKEFPPVLLYDPRNGMRWVKPYKLQ